MCVCVVFESCSKRKYAKKMVVKITATDANTAKTWDATKMNDEGVVDLDSYEFRDNFFDYIDGI